MATAGILTCQEAHSNGNLIQEINKNITGQSKEKDINDTSC